MRNKKGFTLIELLVVIAIIGLLATLAVVALQNAREKSRDAKRVADVKQVQTALDLYFADQTSYPDDGGAPLQLGQAGSTEALCDTGYAAAGACAGTVYMDRIPADPIDDNKGTADTDFRYMYTVSADSMSYTIDFALEGGSGGLAAGAHDATPAGLR